MTLHKARNAEHHLNIDDRLASLLETYHKVTLEDDEFPERLTWCLEHCKDKFRDLNENGYRAWYFKNEHDALMFSLKWGRRDSNTSV